MKRNNNQGFTLIEMLISVALLGLTFSFAVPIFGNVLDSARTKADQASMNIYNSFHNNANLNEVNNGDGTYSFYFKNPDGSSAQKFATINMSAIANMNNN